MSQWLFRAFAFAVGAGLTYALLVSVFFAALAVDGGALICEGVDDDCGGPVVDFWNRTMSPALAWAICLAGGSLLAAKAWRQGWRR